MERPEPEYVAPPIALNEGIRPSPDRQMPRLHLPKLQRRQFWVRQIVEHLIENAVKYAPPDTAITIDWSLAEGVARLGVSDEGPGIPEEWRERIFEPYARRDTHTARGSGIGLYAPSDWANPWEPACGVSQPSHTGRDSSSRCRPRSRSDVRG